MGRIFISLVSLFIVVGAALVYWSTTGTSSLVLMPSELVARAEAKDLRRVRVGGRVTDPIAYQTEPSMVLRFSVKDPKGSEQSVPVVYEGLKPDMFAAGRDVLIDGDFIGGTVRASKLQTQCPSKYEPAVPGEQPASKEQSRE